MSASGDDRGRRQYAERIRFLPRKIYFQKSILSGNVGGRAGRCFVACMLGRDDQAGGIVRTEEEVATRVLSERSRRDYEMVRFVYACYLLRLEYGIRFPDETDVLTPPGLNRVHLADPACQSFAWHIEGAPIA
jgi:hypothetical protein